MQEFYKKRDLESQQIALEEEMGAPKPVFITAAGWFFRVSGDQFARGGPAPEDQAAFPRLVELDSTFLARLMKDYPASLNEAA